MLCFSKLPIDLINIIISYNDTIVLRNGKYIDRINKLDPRYKIVNQRKIPIWFDKNRWMFYFKIFNGFENRGFCFEHRYEMNNDLHYFTKLVIFNNKNGSFTPFLI